MKVTIFHRPQGCRAFIYFTFFLLLFPLLTQAQKINVLMQHGDMRRTGWNAQEKILNTKHVNKNSFGKLFSADVDDQLYAQPLVLSNVKINGTLHSILIAASVNNTVYAFDADDGTLFYKHNYTITSMRPPINTDLTGACGGNYTDFSGKMGIVGTPVIDSTTHTMYFVSRNINLQKKFFQYLHAIDLLANGAERPGSPVLIEAVVSGNGSGNISGQISFDPQKQNQRSGLFLLNGIVYIPYSSHCDWGPYHGWILGYDVTSLKQKIVYNTTPEGYNGGIWMSGAAPAIDENGNIYAAVGNGSVGTISNPSDIINRSESAIRLAISGNTLKVKSFFTPKNWLDLERADLDFGVTQMMLIPNTNMVATGCKDGNIYIMDRDNMGGLNLIQNQVIQTISLGSSKTMRSSLSYYKGPSKAYLYTWSENAALKAFPFSASTGKFDEASAVIGTTNGPSGQNGTLLSVSSDGSKAGTGILWASHAESGDAIHEVRPGILRAFDANDVTKELWNSNMNSSDGLGKYAKFVCPTIANGKVYMATFSNSLIAYGLGDTTQQTKCEGSINLALNKPAIASSIESPAFPARNAFDNIETTRWASALGKDPQWLSVDLGTTKEFCSIVLTWEFASAKDYQIQISSDGTNWRSIYTMTGNNSLKNTIQISSSARFIRLYGTARNTPYGFSLYEFQIFGKALKSCAVPAESAVQTKTRTSADLTWTPVSGALSYNLKYKSVNAPAYTGIFSEATIFKVKGLSCGQDYLFQVQANCTAIEKSEYSSAKGFNTLACDPNCGFLPTRWLSQDIGDVRNPGETCYNNAVFNIKAGGAHIGGTADAFRFTGTTFRGNGNITARIDKIEPLSANTFCGIMFRDSLNPQSRNIALILNGNGTAILQYRKTSGVKTQIDASFESINAPYWVKLVKKNNRYSGYTSRDSILWTQIGAEIELGFGGGTILAGLVIAGKDSANSGNGVLSHVPNFFSTDTIVNKSCTPTFTISPALAEICPNEKTKFVLQGKNLHYSWAPSDSIIALNDSVFFAAPASTTTYNVTARRDGCEITTKNRVFVLVNPNPLIAITPQVSTICKESGITLTANGNASIFLWKPSGSLSSATNRSVDASPASSTIYSVTAYSLKGCSSVAKASVQVKPTCGLTVKFRRPAGIRPPRIFYWNTVPGTATSAWPGPLMTPDTDLGPDWYKYTINKAESSSLLFHDDAGYRTADQHRVVGGCFDGIIKTWSKCRITAPILTISPAGDNYPDGEITVTMEATDSNDENPLIYYTTDGTTPTDSSDSFIQNGTLTLSDPTTLQAFAENIDGEVSEIQSEDFTFQPDSNGISASFNSPKDIKVARINFWNINTKTLENMKREIIWTIQPNPASEYTTLSFQNLTEKNLEIRIINSIGQEIYRESITTNSASCQKQIAMEYFIKGIYNVVINDAKRLSSRLLIVQ